MSAPTISCGSPPAGTVAVPYSHTLPNTHTGSVFTVAVTGGALPGGLTMNSAGVITGTPTTPGTFPFTATITQPDSGLPAFNTLSDYIGTTFVNEANGALGAYGNPLPGTVRLSAARWQLSVVNGPVTWNLLGGPVTPVSSTSVSYTFDFVPTAAGDYSFTLQATNSAGSTTKTFTIGVGLYPGPGNQAFGGIGPFDQFVLLKDTGEQVIGPAFIGDALYANGWTNPFAPGVILQLYGPTPPNPNFAININTGPSDIGYGVAGVGTYSVPVRGQNNSSLISPGYAPFTVSFTILDSRPPSGDGGTASVNCSITIAGTPAVNCGSPPGGKVGTAYSHTFPATGGTPPYAFILIAGSFPPGLLLTSGTGNLSGTPTLAGDYPITISVVDGNGLIGTANCSLHIDLDLQCNNPSDGAVGALYSHAMVVNGATPPNTFTITGGALPPGLSLAGGSGAISGTPTTVGTYNFTIGVVDSAGNTATINCSIHIKVGIDCNDPPVGTLGDSYSHALTISGAPAGSMAFISAGALPAGLAIDNTGLISGTPTLAGAYSFTATVNTPSSGSASVSCSIVISGGGGSGSIDITCANPPSGKVGVPYNHTFPVTGATGPTTYSVVVGALPPGVTLDPATGDLSGTPTAPGTYSFSVKVQQ